MAHRLTSVGGSSSSSLGSIDSKLKKSEEPPKVEYSTIPKRVVEKATETHISVVKDVVEQHYRNRYQTDQHMLIYVEEEWLITESMLTQERGIWGPYNESKLTKWMLDMAEGPCRMRKKLVRNDMFYFNYPYQRIRRRTTTGGSASVDMDAADGSRSAAAIDKPHKYKKPSSHDSKLWYEQHRAFCMFERKSTSDDASKIVEEYDDCDVSVTTTNEEITSIDEEMRKIGFQALAKQHSFQRSDDDEEEASATESSSTDNSDEKQQHTVDYFASLLHISSQK